MATAPKKPRAPKAPQTEPKAPQRPVPNLGPSSAMTPRRVELNKRLYQLARSPDGAEEFERVRAELAALPPDA